MPFSISRLLTRGAAIWGLLLLGCGPDFDPPSELHALRVLGVQKDQPYAEPGQTVNLQMLWQDASALAPRPVSVAWSAPCFDPPGDLYYACFSDPTLLGGMLTLGQETTSFVMPSDIISRRPAAARSNNAEYGVAYVFFALCAGNFVPVPVSEASEFPLGCADAAGKLLGADDFVAGYTAVYSFQGFSNNNPVLGGFRFNGHDFAADADGVCLGEACRALAGSSPASEVDCADPKQAARCVPTCKDDGDPSCPAYGLKPQIDPAASHNSDLDDVSAKLLGRTVGEQMWVNYYSEAGGFKSSVRLLNDATAGWNDNYGTDFYAPKVAGPFRVWAVAHDNRGGVAWSGITLQAQ